MGTKVNINGNVKFFNTTENGDINNNQIREIEHPKYKNIWISGSFFIALIIIIITLLFVIVKLLPFYLIPIIIIGTILLYSIVGAFILKYENKITDKKFSNLMALSFKYIPFLAKETNKQE